MAESSNDSRMQDVQHYLETATHLNEEQRNAMLDGRPFIGMTLGEAELAMTLLQRQVVLSGEILQGKFRSMNGLIYIIAFDRGTPNRVVKWTSFTSEDMEELSTFPDPHPCPPIILPDLDK
jgi:hypothetical protein